MDGRNRRLHYSSTSAAVAGATEGVVGGIVMVCVGCMVLLCAHISGSILLSDFAEYMTCKGPELGA